MHYHFGLFSLDVRNSRLSGPEGDIAVRPLTLRLLHELLQAAPMLVSHDDLLDRVWGRHEVSPGVVSQSVRELRRALEDSAQSPRYIETRHKLGYCFIAPVLQTSDEESDRPDAPAAEATNIPLVATASGASAQASTASPAAAEQIAAKPRRIFPSLIVLSALALGALGVIWQVWPPDSDPESRRFADVEIARDGRPQEPQAQQWYREGLAALQVQNFATASEKLEAALRREPDSIAAKAALAEALLPLGQRERALTLARSAVAQSQSLPRAEKLRVGSFLAGLEYHRADQIAQLTALFALDPGDTEAGIRLVAAQIAAARTDDADATLQRLEALDDAIADPARLSLLRAKMAALRGDHPQRAQAARAAESAARSPQVTLDALLELGWAQLLGGETDAARATLTRIDQQIAEVAQPATAIQRDMLAATLLRGAGQFDAAIERFEAAKEQAAAQGNRIAAAAAQREAAYVMVLAGRHVDAQALLQPMLLTEHEALGDPRMLASILDVLALANQRGGDIKSAQTLGERALRAYVEAEDRIGEAGVRNNLGMLFARSGRFEDAQPQWESALALFEARGDLRGAAVVLSNLSGVYLRLGRQQSAREADERALAIFRQIDAVPEIARLQFNLGLQDRLSGNLVAAEGRMREALQGFEQTQSKDSQLQAIATLAELLMARADAQAADALLQSANIDQATPPQRTAAVVSARARLATMRGDVAAASEGFADALNLRQQANLDDWALMSELDLAELAAHAGKLAEAEHGARRVRREMIKRGDAQAAVQAGLLLAGVQFAQRRETEAGALLTRLEAELSEHPDAMQTQRLDFLLAATRADDSQAALAQVAASASAMGFELLALRAEILANGPGAASARATLAQRGIAGDGLPSPLPY